ncbi:MAG: alpha-galactosidase [Bacteroidetes bacterium 24-39-8]|jgi:alpha-galactosidase|nr:MAG: alpha-galactosidase [Bacteroidetes bacterium 24-39-8]OZA64948.1 MAG: alpha-galactosidase [Sphingobacteriia bacterium 39-39-8]HQR92609.1 NPCBM/NEW2 domain-containing protein [Sediminibacterium sp.]HQS54375.1 NPCBM/NEW2 domain-containing protein [Sediminibacterium sp.]
MLQKYLLAACLLLLVLQTKAQTFKTIWMDELPISTYSEGMRPVQVKTNYGKDTMRMGNLRFTRGLGAQSPCVIPFLLDGKAKRFQAIVGADNQGNKDIPLSFFVVGDGKVLFESKEMRHGDATVAIDLDLTGIKRLGLLITDHVGGVGNKRTYGNWANAQIDMQDGQAPGYIPNNDQKYILTPPSPKQPKIHSAKLFGVTPGNPFLFTIATTGERPIQFSVDQLPKGLIVSKETGIISGVVKERGDYAVVLHAKNKFGAAAQKLIIRVGDTIALTPPMGWNGWNAWEQRLDREKVLASANAMVSKGLRDHGWSYVNIDDSWQGIRSGPDTALQPNDKFPDMKGMVNQIHAMGLKAGLYSTPYISSYGGYPGASTDLPLGGETREMIMKNNQSFHKMGKYQYEKNDARQMAAWGFDFLKYDWRIDVASTERMATALKLSGRDMVLSLSNNAPFEKVTDWVRLSQMYRTGPDIKDSWSSLFPTSFSLDKWAPYSGHGHWMDPDMMIVGDVSIGPVLHPTRLTPDEQYSHISIFSLLAAPMLIGCPVERLDAFTLNLLTNDEVIAVNQDPLGKAGRLVKNDSLVQVWLKPLEDGSYAVGLFNIAGYGTTPTSYFRMGNEPPINYQFDFAALGLKGKWKFRDLWRQKNLGVFSGILSTNIPYHGVNMYQLVPVK